MAVDLDKLSEADRAAVMASPIMDRKPVKSNKYHAEPTHYRGVRYNSKAEAAYAMVLGLREQSGEVAWWLRQVKIQLGEDFSTRVDFLVAKRDHLVRTLVFIEAHEVKGKETREFAKVRKLWPKYAPFPLHIIKRGEVEVIEGK